MQPERRGVVAVIRRGDLFLVIERAAEIRAPGAWCFPGGGIEPGETEPQALVREMHEELGVAVEPQKRLWQHTTDWGVHLAWWQTALDHHLELRPDPSEVAAVFWLSAAEMLARAQLLSSNRSFLHAWQQGLFAFDELKTPADE